MRDTLHIPTLLSHLRELSKSSSPTKFQIIEAWQLAQTIHGLRHRDDQHVLDEARRDIMQYLSRSDNPWNQPQAHAEHLRVHVIAPSIHKIRSWMDVELTPELSWSVEYAGRSIPNHLVKRLRKALGKQHVNLKMLLREVG